MISVIKQWVGRGVIALLVSLYAMTSLPVLAGVDQSIVDAITKGLQSGRKDLKVVHVDTSQIPGLYKVSLNGTTLYSDAKGTYFIAGDLYQVTTNGFVNLGEMDRNVSRAEKISKLDPKDMIIFPATSPRKGTITVFTDVDCYYCQKLHQEVPEMNEMGIEVRYLAYPRAGIGSKSYDKIASAWCAKDPNDAITKLKNKQTIPTNVCDDNPVAAEYRLGQQLGVKGTPAIVMENGRLLPGYLPADKMAATLGIK